MIETHIRELNWSDLDLILAWRNHPNVRQFMFTQHEISLDEHRHWFLKVSQDASHRQCIVEVEEQPIGYVQFSHVAEGGVADWGFYAAPEALKGTGKIIGTAALDYAFSELKLHKVCGQAIQTNKVSIEFHLKLGFIQEGILREHQQIEGIYHNLFCFGLLASEWHQKNID